MHMRELGMRGVRPSIRPSVTHGGMSQN